MENSATAAVFTSPSISRLRPRDLLHPNVGRAGDTPVPEVRDFWKKASYEWRRRLASASRLALRCWPLLPPFARRQCPRLTPAQRPEVCHPPRVLMAHVRPTATPAHLSRCLSGMASRSDLYHGPFPLPKQVFSSAKLRNCLTKFVHGQ